MNRERSLFYGFFVGFAMMNISVPELSLWSDIIEVIDGFFKYSGFLLFVICGIPLIINVFKSTNNNN